MRSPANRAAAPTAAATSSATREWFTKNRRVLLAIPYLCAVESCRAWLECFITIGTARGVLLRSATSGDRVCRIEWVFACVARCIPAGERVGGSDRGGVSMVNREATTDLLARKYRQPKGVEPFGVEPIPEHLKTVKWYDIFFIVV